MEFDFEKLKYAVPFLKFAKERQDAIKYAKESNFDEKTIKKIKTATSIEQINNIITIENMHIGQEVDRFNLKR